MKRSASSIMVVLLIISSYISACTTRNDDQLFGTTENTPEPTPEQIYISITPFLTTEPVITTPPSPEPTPTPTLEPTSTPVPPIVLYGQLMDVIINQGESVSLSVTAENYLNAVWILKSPNGEETKLDNASGLSAGVFYEIEQNTTLKLQSIPPELNGWEVYCKLVGLNGIDETITNTAKITVHSWLDLYEPVFVNYRSIAKIEPQNGYDFSIDTYGLMGSYDFHTWEEVTYGFILRDIDGNGIPELIVGNMASLDDNVIHAMFTLIDNQPQKVLNSWSRNRHYLSNSGGIYHAGSSGAMWSDYYMCSYSGTTIVPLYGCYTCDGDNYGFYKVTNGDRNTGTSELISQESFRQYLDSLEATIIPLNDLSLIWIF